MLIGHNPVVEKLSRESLYSYEQVLRVLDVTKYSVVLTKIILHQAALLGEQDPYFLADYLMNIKDKLNASRP